MNTSDNNTVQQWVHEWLQPTPISSWEGNATNGYADKPYLLTNLIFWTHGEEKLNAVITYQNSIHPTIKFTSEV